MCRDTVRSERLTGISGYCDEGSAPSPVSFVRVRLRSAGDVHPGRRIAKEAASSTQDVERRPRLRQHVDERPETFPAPEAHRILQRLEIHCTPKHASWLNMGARNV